MHTRRAEYAVFFAVFAAAATVAILTAGRGGAAQPAAVPGSWASALPSRPAVDLGSRVIVVLRTPSLGERVAAAGGALDIEQEQAWTKVVLATQRLLLARLALKGVIIHAEERFARVLDGFSAVVPSDVVPIVERDPEVAGVYPVRAAYPAAVSVGGGRAAGFGHPLDSGGIDGRGVTVAVLDTGVDARVPLLRGRVLPQIDVAGAGGDRHGTEMAAVVARVAPGASVLPIRVAGSYARSDQVIAGLERAVDPNGDGDAHDASRIALVALDEPFAGFPDGPESLAVAGARALDVLVVAPSGNEGAAGAAYGDIAAPGGAPDALTVGALDTRTQLAQAHVVVRSGLDTLYDATTPLAGDTAPATSAVLPVTASRAMFDAKGGSLVAGRAALVGDARSAADAGASAVLVTGLAAGALGATVPIPVVPLPARVAASIRRRLRSGVPVSLTIGAGRAAPNEDAGHVAPFSSTGLAYDGSVKPDLVAPGVAFRGLGRSTASGSSVAAAVVAGAAALLAQARPALGADALAGLLVGTARPLPSDAVAAQGAGEVDVGAAAAGELAASPPTLALGASDRAGRKVVAAFTLTNLSARGVDAAIAIRTQHEGAATIDFTIRPSHVSLAPGRSVLVHVDALTASAAVGTGTADGAVVASVAGGGTLRIPWAMAFAQPFGLLRGVTLTGRVLTVDAGSVTTSAGVAAIRPLARLDVRLANAKGRDLGLLARIRDVLPGRYVFRLTGRGPGGSPLAPGRYAAVVLAFPDDGGPPGRRKLGFLLR